MTTKHAKRTCTKFFFLTSHMYKLIHPDVLVFITDVKNTQTLQSHAVFLLTVTSIWKRYSGKAAKCFTEHFFKNDSPYNSIQTCIRRKQPVWGQTCLILTFLQAQTKRKSLKASLMEVSIKLYVHS